MSVGDCSSCSTLTADFLYAGGWITLKNGMPAQNKKSPSFVMVKKMFCSRKCESLTCVLACVCAPWLL